MNAFDVLAPSYDADFTRTAIGTYLRGITHQRLAPYIKQGDSVLELGCGTGEDALWLATQGAHVTATDASHKMLDLTRHKTHGKTVQVAQLDMNALPVDYTQDFDGVFSNFGALNCVEHRSDLARWLASRVKANGWLALVVMPPFCFWETLWHGVHGDFTTSTRRRKPATFKPDEHSLPMNITCPTPRELAQDFAPHFRVEQVLPLGVFLPHSAAYGVVEKRPKLLRLLQSLDHITQHVSLLSRYADHYWIVLRRHP
jgi:SAM-dependent methyltransferase